MRRLRLASLAYPAATNTTITTAIRYLFICHPLMIPSREQTGYWALA